MMFTMMMMMVVTVMMMMMMFLLIIIFTLIIMIMVVMMIDDGEHDTHPVSLFLTTETTRHTLVLTNLLNTLYVTMDDTLPCHMVQYCRCSFVTLSCLCIRN